MGTGGIGGGGLGVSARGVARALHHGAPSGYSRVASRRLIQEMTIKAQRSPPQRAPPLPPDVCAAALRSP